MRLCQQPLAMMDHPNIARVLDAGATDTGRRYFVMELVRGVPITEYCDKNRLSTQDRLRPFVPVCQAIQHAHQKGVIHRDIKPSNVMVTLHDGNAVTTSQFISSSPASSAWSDSDKDNSRAAVSRATSTRAHFGTLRHRNHLHRAHRTQRRLCPGSSRMLFHPPGGWGGYRYDATNGFCRREMESSPRTPAFAKPSPNGGSRHGDARRQIPLLFPVLRRDLGDYHGGRRVLGGHPGAESVSTRKYRWRSQVN